MKKNEKKKGNNYFYLFLVLFVAFVLSQVIFLNQEGLMINNEITGAIELDPAGGLGNLFGSDVSVQGESYQIWLLLAVFAVVFSIMYNGTSLLSFFQGDERRGTRIIISLAISAITLFATPIMSLIAILISYVGAFGSLAVIFLLGAIIYIYTHQTLRDRIREVWPGGRNQNQQQNQNQNQQNIGQLLRQNNYQPMQVAHAQLIQAFNGNNPNMNTINNRLGLIRQNALGIINYLGNAGLAGQNVNLVMTRAGTINTRVTNILNQNFNVNQLQQLRQRYNLIIPVMNQLGQALNNL